MRQRKRPSRWTDTHAIDDQEIAIGADRWLLRGTLAITWDYDANADCDADGHRGHAQISEDERRFTLLGASRCGHDGEWQGHELTGADIPTGVREAADDWADSCEAPDREPRDDDDGPEYDRDDDDERRERRHADDGGW